MLELSKKLDSAFEQVNQMKEDRMKQDEMVSYVSCITFTCSVSIRLRENINYPL